MFFPMRFAERFAQGEAAALYGPCYIEEIKSTAYGRGMGQFT